MSDSEKDDKHKKAYAKALKDLFAADDATVLSAVKALKEFGDHRTIHPLLEVMLHGSDPVKAAVEEVLFELKDTKAVDQLIAALDDEKYAPVRATILAAFWNSGQWPVGHVAKLCDIAIHGSYQEAFEVLTVIEHMEEDLAPAEVAPALESIREYLMVGEGHENYPIIESLHAVLNAFDDV